ncbi:MAG: DUF268 domain-containing protein [bacterium]
MEKHVIRHFIKYIIKQLPFVDCTHKKIKKYKNFIKEFHAFKSGNKTNRFEIRWEDRYPCLNDKTSNILFDTHYIFHTAWAARILVNTKPREHIDISSSLFFVALVSAFIPIKYFNYRSVNLKISGLRCVTADILALPFPDASISSLSCMHTVEHIGLGRYGDPIDSDGDLKAISEIKRVLAIGGTLLFVVPIGQPRIEFNAHRIYHYDQIISYFEGFELKNFSLIPDHPKNRCLIENASREMATAQEYGCGCFWLNKIK